MEIRPPNKQNYESLIPIIEGALGIPLGLNLLLDRVLYDAHYDPNFCLMAREKGVVQGYLAGVLKGKTGYLKLLAIGESFQRKGLGREMLGRFEDRLQGEGATELFIGEAPPRDFFPGVPQRYAAAHAFFKSQGYQEAGQRWTASLGVQGQMGALKPALGYSRFRKLIEKIDSRWMESVEEAFTSKEAQAVSLEIEGNEALLLARPGRLGPLFFDGDDQQPSLIELVSAGAALATKNGPCGLRDARPLSWWQNRLDLASFGSSTVFSKLL